MKDFSKLLYPLKIKLNIEKWLGYFLSLLSASLTVIFIFSVLSKFVYIKGMDVIIIAVVLFFTAISFIMIIVNPVTLCETAKAGDKLGMDERLSTALEIMESGKKGGVYDLALNDAFNKGREKDLGKLYKIKVSHKMLKMAALLFVAVIASGFIKNPHTVDIGKVTNPQIKELEEIKKTLNSEKMIDDAQLENINKEINSVVKALEQSKTRKDAIQKIDEAQQRLKNLEKTGSSKDIKSISQSLEGQSSAQKLMEALSSGEQQNVGESLNQLNENAQKLSNEDLEKLLDQLKNAAENVDDEALKEALENYANEIALGNFSGSTNGLDKLKKEMTNAVSQSQNLKSAVENINQTLAEASQAVESSKNSAQGNGSGSSGNGEGQGQNQSQNQGQNGQSQGAGQGNGKGSGWGQGHVETEEEFSREAENKAGYDTQVGGAENDGGQKEMTVHRTQGSDGELVPYDEILGDYKTEALRSIDESTVPYGMKKLVADYFSELEK